MHRIAYIYIYIYIFGIINKSDELSYIDIDRRPHENERHVCFAVASSKPVACADCLNYDTDWYHKHRQLSSKCSTE